jgi:YidC/Oxa1 family membrane protein insertase
MRYHDSMFGHLFTSFIHEPIYNALVFLVGIVPGGDVGVAIIILTAVIKFILLPLSIGAIRSQVAMKEIDPELKRLKEELKGNQEELGKRTMALFKEKKVNPVASILVLLIQIPIVIGLYRVFLSEATGKGFDAAGLYSFVHLPLSVSFSFLGVIDLTGKSIALALIVMVTQFIYARMLTIAKPDKSEPASFQTDLARSMHLQMRYVFPLLMGGIAYAVSAAVALYFVVSNIFAIGQELAVKKLRTHGTP